MSSKNRSVLMKEAKSYAKDVFGEALEERIFVFRGCLCVGLCLALAAAFSRHVLLEVIAPFSTIAFGVFLLIPRMTKFGFSRSSFGKSRQAEYLRNKIRELREEVSRKPDYFNANIEKINDCEALLGERFADYG